jgi:hypothetical protein
MRAYNSDDDPHFTPLNILNHHRCNWIREEELLLKYAESESFQLTPLDQITVTFIYVDRNQDAVDITDISINTTVTERKSILEWSKLKRLIDERSHWNGLRYLFCEASLYHVSVDYDNLDLFYPPSTLTKIDRDKDIKLPASLPIFHDISQLFVIMREVIPIPLGQTLKSILKTGSKIGKTKKVRISDTRPEFISAGGGRRTRKQP